MDDDRKRTEPFRKMPTENRQIDCYRGLTVLTRIYNKYYPIPDEERLVNYEQFQGLSSL